MHDFGADDVDADVAGQVRAQRALELAGPRRGEREQARPRRHRVAVRRDQRERGRLGHRGRPARRRGLADRSLDGFELFGVQGCIAHGSGRLQPIRHRQAGELLRVWCASAVFASVALTRTPKTMTAPRAVRRAPSPPM